MHAVAQHFRGAMPLPPALPQRLPRDVALPIGVAALPALTQRMSTPGRPKGEYRRAQPEGTPVCTPKPRDFFIQGITGNGREFRPGDWSERLAGALSSFRPKRNVGSAGSGGSGGIGAHIGYSPYCIPRVIDGVKCVIVNEALRGLEPMAWDFVMNFARDNDLRVAEACGLPEPPMGKD